MAEENEEREVVELNEVEPESWLALGALVTLMVDGVATAWPYHRQIAIRIVPLRRADTMAQIMVR